MFNKSFKNSWLIAKFGFDKGLAKVKLGGVVDGQ
jgi:hypothetical protein